MIKEFDVTLRVAIDISAYGMGLRGIQVVPTIKIINKKDTSYTLYSIVDEILNTLANNDPEYNEAINSVREAAEDRSVIDPRD